MSPRGLNWEKIGDDRLNLAVKHTRLNLACARQLAEFAAETDQPMPTRATAAGDPARLRGVPCVGRGLAGAIRGSRPDTHIYMERGVSFDLAVLVRDNGNGVSPGTDPEQACLDAEAETERLLREKPGKVESGVG